MNNLKQIITAGLAAAYMVSPHAMAKDYQSEIILYTVNTDSSAGAYENTYTLLNYTYYLNRVDTSNKPLAEAAFLDRVANINAGFYLNDRDYDSGSQFSGSGLQVGYEHLNKGSPLLLSVSYDSAGYEYKNAAGATTLEFDFTFLILTAGYYLDDSTRASVSLVKSDIAYSTAGYKDYSTQDIYFEFKKIMNPGGNNPVNLEGQIGLLEHGSEAKSNTLYEVSADYYLDRMKSVGARYSMESGDDKDEEGTTIAVHGQFYFTAQLALHVEMESFSAKNSSGTDHDNTTLMVNYRF